MSVRELSGIRLEVNGEWYPPNELAWIQWAPCGCLGAVMTVRDSLTPKEAWDEFHDDVSKEYAERERKLGYRVELVTFEHYRTLPFGECAHDPQWGRPVSPIPDGYEWRSEDGYFGKKTNRNHLFEPKPEGERYWRNPLLSLCGRAKDYGRFKAESRASRIDCAACSKKAAEQISRSSETSDVE